MKVAYIGGDIQYWDRLKSRFRSTYQELNFDFLHYVLNQDSDEHKLFKELYSQRIHILYIDYSVYEDKAFYLSKLLTRNCETRLISLVGLFDYTKGTAPMERALGAAVRINHFKSIEIHDVVYDPISLLDVNLTHSPDFVFSDEVGKMTIWQLLKTGYIESNFFHVETNSYLELGTIVDISEHPLYSIMPSKKAFVAKFYDRDLYFNRRFAYDLEFIYIDSDYFSSTNENWLRYKKLKEDPDSIEEYNIYERKQIEEDMQERKRRFKKIKREIDFWLADRRGQIVPKRLKILIIDKSLDLLLSMKEKVNEFPYSLNFQTKLINDFYAVERSCPQLIVFKFDKENNLEVFRELILRIKQIEKYDPHILAYHSEQDSKYLRSLVSYNNLISYKGDIEIDEIQKLAQMLDQKFSISQADTKVFFKSYDTSSFIYLKHEIKIISMSESIMYFLSPKEIPMWTVFVIKHPIPMLITVVPHKSDSAYKGNDHCYRALINGVGEAEKADIRALINRSFEEEEEKNS